jgi:hypothetical protein
VLLSPDKGERPSLNLGKNKHGKLQKGKKKLFRRRELHDFK